MLSKKEIEDNFFSVGTYDARRWRNASNFQELMFDTGQSLAEKLFILYFGIKGECEKCGAPTTFLNWKVGHRKFCSTRCAQQSETVAAKRKTTFKALYGTDNLWLDQSWRDETRRKMRLAHDSRRTEGKLETLRLAGWKATNAPDTLNSDTVLEWRHSCGKKITRAFAKVGYFVCPSCSIKSKPQQLIRDIVESAGLDFEENRRKILHGKEIDIFIPSLKLGFEINGAYWHQDRLEDDLTKNKIAASRGIKLITIFEHEIALKPTVVTHFVNAQIQSKTMLHARKLKVATGVNVTGFLNAYHIQGAIRGKTAALLMDKDIVAVVVVANARFGNKRQTEILRWCVKPGITIPGGMARCLDALGVSDCVTYCDIARSPTAEDTVYAKNGFTLVGKTKPGYVWWKRNEKTISRYQSQKRHLPELLGNKFDETKTEKENMSAAGWLQVFNYGNWIFKK